MIAALITALIVISLVLLAGCAGLMWRVHEDREDMDLVIQKLVEVLEERDAGLVQLLEERDAGRLPPGHLG